MPKPMARISAEPRARPLTIHDVAAQAGVSKSTVSLVLQGSPLVKQQTAQQVRAAARSLGYVYNRRAGELRRQSSRVIGVLISDLMNPFFAELLVGLERTLVDAGYAVLMAHTAENLALQERVLQTMREQNVAGVALCPARGTPAALARTLSDWGLPLVVMVRTLGRGSHDFAGADNALGVERACTHLLRAGHCRIAFLGGLSGPVLGQRLRGYRSALGRAGVAVAEDAIFACPPSRGGGREGMLALLDARPEIAAAICYNDLVAFGALSALGQRGRQAGRDFALMGFDNVLGAAHSNPPLSTIDVRPAELGGRAAAILLHRIDHPGAKRQSYLADPVLIVRSSA